VIGCRFLSPRHIVVQAGAKAQCSSMWPRGVPVTARPNGVVLNYVIA